MVDSGRGHETAKWRTTWLLLAFAVLVGIGAVTVVLPELEDVKEDVQEDVKDDAQSEERSDGDESGRTEEADELQE